LLVPYDVEKGDQSLKMWIVAPKDIKYNIRYEASAQVFEITGEKKSPHENHSNAKLEINRKYGAFSIPFPISGVYQVDHATVQKNATYDSSEGVWYFEFPKKSNQDKAELIDESTSSLIRDVTEDTKCSNSLPLPVHFGDSSFPKRSLTTSLVRNTISQADFFTNTNDDGNITVRYGKSPPSSPPPHDRNVEDQEID